jgi:hypothetical protein
MFIAFTADAASGDDEGFIASDTIFDEVSGFGVMNQGSRGDFDNQVIALFSGLLSTLTIFPVFCLKAFFKPKLGKRSTAGSGENDDIPALSTVAAVGAASGNVFFPSKADTALAPVAGLDRNLRFVNEFHSE